MKIFKKWWFWLIVVVVIVAIAGANGKKDNQASVSSSQEQSAEKKEQTAKIGESTTVGKFEVTVNGIKENKTIGENEFLQKKTENQFLIVDVSVKNLDKDSRTIDTSMFKIIDDKGSEYSPLSDGDLYVNSSENKMFLSKINPNIAKKGNVVFEMPEGIAGLKLQVGSGIGFKAGESATIDLGK
ncbi:DUF4352 domain-containing protein [Paenibacillus larvae]|nr:DUF4352 domain-containing protein [Paenibacillus larvae]YP_009193850.1 DUF4352 domain-containing protein [Paenibacillus phage Harrison]ALA12599.1 telomeric repeat-binding factor 2 [Paenibacillus phage Paisley]ALA12438.1 telomeric repeat-binding factor 2 [Paenibacillus phage Harrison]AQR76576.1 DUF4352 domain-containing protein [Paenibacillus larvae subsp. larvae]MCY7476759.1 DUF4352 domain-containing protein [Paenibacillus larvae]MCY7490772.1 DUF4352 domain-containing protein [Paenibacillu